MIEYLKGKIASVSETNVVLDVNGVGYLISVSESTVSLLPGIGEEATVYTHMSVREDGVSLYGFPTFDDLKVFRLLITVTGIGPKGALGILSAMTPDDLRFAIISGDSRAIARAPGVGKKTAERIILDLKDKIDAGSFTSFDTERETAVPSGVSDSARSEAVEALVSLGYPSTDSLRAVKEALAVLGGEASPEMLLKTALKVIQ